MLIFYLSLIDNETDRDIFIRAYEQYRDGLIRYVSSYTGRADLAEDIVQDTFLNLAKGISHWNKLTGKQQKAYLIVSARNQAITAINKRNTDQKHDMAYVKNYGSFFYRDILSEVINKESLHEFYQFAIDHLSDNQIDVLVLKYHYGYKNKEIAQILNIKANAVAQRLTRLKQFLRTIMKDQGYDTI